MRKFNSRDFELQLYKRFHPVLFRKRKPASLNSESFIDSILKDLTQKGTICVVLSGPSSKEMIKEPKAFYFCTNNSYRLLWNSEYAYFLYDPYFIYRYLKRNNYINKSKVVVFHPNTKYEKIRQWNIKIDHDVKRIFRNFYSNNIEFLLSFTSDSEDLKSIESFFYKELSWDGEVYNSGILLTMVAAFFSVKSGLPMHVYGLDMGVGGLVHADTNRSIVHPNFLSDRNLKGVSNILLNVSNLLGAKFINHSYFRAS